jgi:CHAT domain-containing protein
MVVLCLAAVPARGAALVKGKLSGTRASEVELELADDKVVLPAGEKPFAHPTFWAAFTLLGDPD